MADWNFCHVCIQLAIEGVMRCQVKDRNKRVIYLLNIKKQLSEVCYKHIRCGRALKDENVEKLFGEDLLSELILDYYYYY